MQKHYFIPLVFLLGLSISGCQEKEDPVGNIPENPFNSSPEERLFKGYELLNLGSTAFFEFAAKTNGNSPAALYETGKLILDTGIPQDVYIVDSTYMYIVMNPDITMLFRIDYVDENGKSIYRGGPNGGSRLMRLLSNNSCSDAIPNNKVLLWGAADNLPFNYSRIKNTLSESDFEFEITELTHEQCTPATLKTLDQYGLVLVDTHGLPDAILTGSKISFPKGAKTLKEFKEVMVATLSQDGYDDFLKGNLLASWAVVTPKMAKEEWWKNGNSVQWNDEIEVWADMRFLENLPDLSNTIIFNNSCYSGATINEIKNGNIDGVPVNLVKTETVANAFLARNPISYYGWNHDDLSGGPVDNDFAIQAEENLIKRLADSADSTGMAHRKDDDSYFESSYPPEYPKVIRLNLFNKDSYCYQDPCEETFTDPRDGQEYKMVCIGDQVWMAENLNFKSDESWCYADNPNNCETYGRLYSSESVKTACPPGWHLPSVEEYEELNGLFPKHMAGADLKSVTGWNEPNTGANNNSGWSGLPGGEKNLLLDLYMGLGNFGYWWTSTTNFSSDAHRTRYVRLSYNKVILGIAGSGPEDGADAYSCRCIADE